MKRRAMSSKHASTVKVGGHVTEHEFADLVGGAVNKGDQKDKKDVIDAFHNFHSVKSGKYWQIFLYRKSRLESNTPWRTIGGGERLANAMVACLDAFPPNFAEYAQNKPRFKLALQEPMRELKRVLENPVVFKGFIEKSMFNFGEAIFLSILPGSYNHIGKTGTFHVFHHDDVCRVLVDAIEVANSKARHAGQTDDQKVLLKVGGVNYGELEVRCDSMQHYREMKFRFNGEKIFRLLCGKIPQANERKSARIAAHGLAARKFKLT